jgi:hypothetical protein
LVALRLGAVNLPLGVSSKVKTGLLVKMYSQICLFFKHKLDLTAFEANISASRQIWKNAQKKW